MSTLMISLIQEAELPDCYGDCGRRATVRLDGGRGFHKTPLCAKCTAEELLLYAQEETRRTA